MTLRLKVKVTKQQRSWHCPYHTPNLKVLTKIFFKLSRPEGILCGGGVTVLNPKYPRLSSGDTITFSLRFIYFSYNFHITVYFHRYLTFYFQLICLQKHPYFLTQTCLTDSRPYSSVTSLNFIFLCRSFFM